MFLIITCLIVNLIKGVLIFIKWQISSQLNTALVQVPCFYVYQAMTRAKCIPMLSKNSIICFIILSD